MKMPAPLYCFTGMSKLKFGARVKSTSMVSLCQHEETENILIYENRVAMVEIKDETIPESIQHSEEKAKHFVLIISGDASQNAESCKQVQSFCQALEERAVPHVAVVPAMKSSPIVWLTEKQRKELLEPPNQTLSAFLKKCYAKAKKILIAVSPNFVSYACPYIKGNRAVDETQNIVHRLFKEMYEEHVDDKRETHRLWPVLLARMDTNRQHIPWFLTRALFYYFPQKQGAENVTELLRTEVLRHR